MDPSAIIKIDAVKAADSDVCHTTDVLELEWFETNKHLLKRASLQGVLLQLEKSPRQKWREGDNLWSQGNCVATIRIKPCLAIKICTDDSTILGDFCYYIGNRHLPMFTDAENNCFVVPYDGNLFEQLRPKFDNYMTLQEVQLLEENSFQNRKYLNGA